MESTKVSVGFESKVYNKAEADFVLDRSFSQFGQPEPVTEKTVEQFFVDYEDLFYQIPVEGNINSHEYLIRKSSELYHLEDGLTDIQPLLDEITLLRSQSVADQQTIIDLKTRLATAGISSTGTDKVAALRTELAEALNESNQ